MHLLCKIIICIPWHSLLNQRQIAAKGNKLMMLSFLFNTNVIMNHDNSLSDLLKASLSHYFNEVNMESGMNFTCHAKWATTFFQFFFVCFEPLVILADKKSENTHVTWHDTLNEVGFITVSQEDSDVFFSFVIWRCRHFRWQVSLIFPLTLLSFIFALWSN